MKRFAVLMLSALASTGGLAEGLPITPGKWEMKSTVTSDIMAQPQVNTLTECLTENELRPDSMSSQNLDQSCTMDAEMVNDNTMRWTISCPQENSEMLGSWEATSTGDTVSGHGEMTAKYGPQEFKMTMRWEGERVGPCD